MPANQCLPFWLPGDTLTGHTTAAVTGKRLVAISGARNGGKPSVAHAGAGAAAFGVAAYDAPTNTDVTIFRVDCVLPITAGAAITAGQALKSDANGKVIPQAGTGIIVGYAVDDAANNADAVVDLRI